MIELPTRLVQEEVDEGVAGAHTGTFETPGSSPIKMRLRI
jgi:hypothetical protein